MLIDFTVGNFLSFKENKTLSMIATAITDFPENAIITDQEKLLRSAVVYGANSSGKSNLMKAFATMRGTILGSFNKPSTATIPVTPFLLSADTSEKPSFFEINFVLGNNKYRYGFEATKARIHAEWLFEAKKHNEKPLFGRNLDQIDVEKEFEGGEAFIANTRENALYLAVADQNNQPLAKSIFKWLNTCNTISGLEHEEYVDLTLSMLDTPEGKSQLIEFYNHLQLGFKDVNHKSDIKLVPIISPDAGRLRFRSIKQMQTIHKIIGKDNKTVWEQAFDLREQESSGTNKIFDLSGAIFRALKNGTILIIDELDSKLHPLITLAITRLFNAPKYNPKNAQLIFATHDTNLFCYGKFRRDQIWFTEKNFDEATDLYSLIEYKDEEGNKIRKDRRFDKDYINGRYGAIPYIGDISDLVELWQAPAN